MDNFEHELTSHIRTMKRLADLIGQEWHDESDTPHILDQIGREHVQAKELQGFLADVQASLLSRRMLRG